MTTYWSSLPINVYTSIVSLMENDALYLRRVNKTEKARCDKALQFIAKQVLNEIRKNNSPIARRIAKEFVAIVTFNSFSFTKLLFAEIADSCGQPFKIASFRSEFFTAAQERMDNALETVWVGKTEKMEVAGRGLLRSVIGSRDNWNDQKETLYEKRVSFSAEEIRDYLNQNTSSEDVTELDCGRLSLTDTSIDIYQLTALKILNLAGNYLSWISADILRLTDLVCLDLSRNRFEKFPPFIGDLVSLQELFLGNRDPHGIPIWPSSNRFTEIPHTIMRLTRLSVLSLEHEVLQSFPSTICQLTQLKNLSLSNNTAIKEIPASIGLLKLLTELDISNTHLEQLPPEIGELVCLKELHAQNNLLSTLPKKIYCLTALQVLNLSFNKLKHIPEETSSALEELHEMNLSHNFLISLPESFWGTFSNLMTLHLNDNNLIEFPPFPEGLLFPLSNLDLSNNKITGFPEGFEMAFSELRWIGLMGNSFSEIPKKTKAMFQKIDDVDIEEHLYKYTEKEEIEDSEIEQPLDQQEGKMDSLDDLEGLLDSVLKEDDDSEGPSPKRQKTE